MRRTADCRIWVRPSRPERTSSVEEYVERESSRNEVMKSFQRRILELRLQPGMRFCTVRSDRHVASKILRGMQFDR